MEAGEQRNETAESAEAAANMSASTISSVTQLSLSVRFLKFIPDFDFDIFGRYF